MKNLRSVLSLILVLVATLLVSCGGPSQTAKAPITYSPEKIAQLQVYVQPVEDAKNRLSELETLIQNENWVDTRTFIHGPLGQLRQDMATLSRALLPKDQPEAKKLSQELFIDFENIDAAAMERKSSAAASEYRQAVSDLNAFLDLVPKSS